MTDGVLLALHREDFNKLLGSLSHIRHMWRFEALRKARAAARAPLPLPPGVRQTALSMHCHTSLRACPHGERARVSASGSVIAGPASSMLPTRQSPSSHSAKVRTPLTLCSRSRQAGALTVQAHSTAAGRAHMPSPGRARTGAVVRDADARAALPAVHGAAADARARRHGHRVRR